MGSIRINCPLITLVLASLITLVAVTASSSYAATNGGVKTAPAGSVAGGKFRLLHLKGRRDRAVCTAKGRCLKKVVTCPASCPTTEPLEKTQKTACFVDCSAACTATCKKLKTTKSIVHQAAYRTWCNKTSHESLCVSMIQANPRNDLKKSPQGLVVILVSAAQVQADATKLFINDALKNKTMDSYDKLKVPLQARLLPFNSDSVNKTLKVDIQQVKDKKRCSDVYNSLDSASSEISYDCSWALPTPVEYPTLKQMVEDVQTIELLIETAQQLLSLIGCGTH